MYSTYLQNVEYKIILIIYISKAHACIEIDREGRDHGRKNRVNEREVIVMISDFDFPLEANAELSLAIAVL